MQIMELRFKNLNSLTGEWFIDFTHPAYSSAGIFAITGPTGSGKSTILDAVCLALYGRTPRLKGINKTSNEIMSRHTGECSAEVTFTTQAGHFRCCWSQHRARKRPDGELQPQRHEIVDAETGAILESKITEVSKVVENVTGMNFERFTRSMLLAQGGFAAFLQAPPSDRAPLLEQITGTEIYGQISIRVHELRTQQRKKLETVQAEFASINLMSSEEEEALRSRLEENLNRGEELVQQLDYLRKAMIWLGDIAGLEKEIASLETEWQYLKQRQKNFAPEKKRLERAFKALALQGDYLRLSNLRIQDQEDHGELEKAEGQLPLLIAALEQAEKAKQEALEQVKTARDTQRQESELGKRVREIDLRWAEQQSRIREMGESITQGERTIADRQKQIQTGERSRQQLTNTLTAIEKYLKENAVDAGLIENLALINQFFTALQEKDAFYNDIDRKLKDVLQLKENCCSSYEQLAATHEQITGRLEECRSGYQQVVEEIEALLQGHELGMWRDELQSLQERQITLKLCKQAMERFPIEQERLQELQKLKSSLDSGLLKLEREIELSGQQREAWKKEVEHREIELALLNHIRDLEEERARLEDGNPCPLCGSTHHPYAQGNIPARGEGEESLQYARDQLQETVDHLVAYQIKKAELVKDLNQNQLDIEEQKETLEILERQVVDTLVQLEMEFTPAAGLSQVNSEIDANQAQIDQYNQLLREAEQKERAEKSAREALEEAQRAFTMSEKKVQQAFQEKIYTEREYERLTKELTALEKQRDQLYQQSRQTVNIYGINELPINELPSILALLKRRREYWQEAQVKKNQIEKDIAALRSELGKQQALIDQLGEELGNKRQEYAKFLQESRILREERLALYGEKNPDEEEKRWAEATEKAEQALEQIRYDYGQAEQEVGHLKLRMLALNKSIEEGQELLKEAEQRMTMRLIQAGFTGEEDYQAACMPPEELELLNAEAQTLEREQSELQARWQDKSLKLKTEQEKKISNQPLEILEEELRYCESQQKELQQEIGALKGTLTRNDQLKTFQQERLKDLEKQSQECLRWDTLHEIIGSADGKKYRNFAQGLTFEMVVAQANRQLQNMSDRYLLIRDDTQPLELNVVDNYQAGEIRSTKNLSGGESFIVSLALALGLSNMASRNVRIDSLFLDEGFGTLDEDTLDTALETLAGLQRENKLIGVISHVPALKERISTQIEVIPTTSGRSRLFGPGCRPIAQ